MTTPTDLPPFPWRVGSIPADHPYVAALHDDRVHRPPDPAPAVPDPLPGQWWPPRLLDPAWIDRHHAEFDLIHLHFGFDASSPDELREWVRTLRARRIPLVYTVHDLVNPHVADSARHLDQLDVLIPAADALATLTPGAAAAIERRWGRSATVLPHPHLVPLHRPRGRREPDRTFTIGVHAKEMRANLDPVPVLDALLLAVADRPEVRIRLDAHPAAVVKSEELARWIERHGDDTSVDVRIHPRMSDDELWTYLEALDLCVLPYRFGTHSGWLEACVDLGVPVLVPDVGHLSEQHGHPVFAPPRTAGPDSLIMAVRRCLDDPGWARRDPAERARDRELLADAHIRLYTGALLTLRQHPTG